MTTTDATRSLDWLICTVLTGSALSNLPGEVG